RGIRMNIQHKIALRFTFLTISIVLIVSMMEYYLANQNTFEDFYKRLEIRAVIAAKTEFEKGEMAQSAFEEIRQLHLETLPYEKEYFIPVNNSSHWSIPAGLSLSQEFFNEAIKN